MWLSSQHNQSIHWYIIRLVFISFFILLSTACSDMSMKQLGRNNQDSLKKITVAEVGSREGQIYTRELRQKLHIGGKSTETYVLASTIKTTSLSTLSVQGGSSLKRMSMTATFKLNDVVTGKNLFADSVSGDATVGAVSSFYGQDESRSHARERLAILLAQRVVRRLQLYFLKQRQ